MPSFGQNLATLRAAANADLRKAVRVFRLNFITDLPGQEGLYSGKEAEALRYLAQDPEPADLSAFPMLAAETGVTAPTPYELAQIWANLGNYWREMGAATDGIRMLAQNQIAAATTRAQIDTALSTAKASLSALYP